MFNNIKRKFKKAADSIGKIIEISAEGIGEMFDDIPDLDFD